MKMVYVFIGSVRVVFCTYVFTFNIMFMVNYNKPARVLFLEGNKDINGYTAKTDEY